MCIIRDVQEKYLYNNFLQHWLLSHHGYLFERITMEGIRRMKLTIGVFHVPFLVLLVFTGLEITKVRNEKEFPQSYQEQNLDTRFGLLICIASAITMEMIFTSIALIGNRYKFLIISFILNIPIAACYIGHFKIFGKQVFFAESVVGAVFSIICATLSFNGIKYFAQHGTQT